MGIQDRKARELRRREEEILQAALALSNRDDWQTVTIEQIALKAEIGKGTIYKHFASKDDIYARLALSFHQLVLRRLQAIDVNLAAVQKLREVVRVFWDVYGTHAEYQRVVEYCQRLDFQRVISEDMRRATEAVEAGFTEVIEAIVKQGIAERVLPDRPIGMLLFGAQSALVGALKLLWLGRLTSSREQYLEELTAFLLAGLTRHAPRQKRGR